MTAERQPGPPPRQRPGTDIRRPAAPVPEDEEELEVRSTTLIRERITETTSTVRGRLPRELRDPAVQRPGGPPARVVEAPQSPPPERDRREPAEGNRPGAGLVRAPHPQQPGQSSGQQLAQQPVRPPAAAFGGPGGPRPQEPRSTGPARLLPREGERAPESAEPAEEARKSARGSEPPPRGTPQVFAEADGDYPEDETTPRLLPEAQRYNPRPSGSDQRLARTRVGRDRRVQETGAWSGQLMWRERKPYRVGVHLLLAALPLLAISAQVFGIFPMTSSAAFVVIPLALALFMLAVFNPHPEERLIGYGMLWGMIATVPYDIVRLDTAYLMNLWGDFIPVMGTWITGDPDNLVLGAIAGYIWRYPGDGGGIGITFFVLAVVTGIHRLSKWWIVAASTAFAVCPTWTGLIATVGLAPNGQTMMFPLNPTTLSLSFIGHIIFGVVLGLGFYRVRRVANSWPWPPIVDVPRLVERWLSVMPSGPARARKEDDRPLTSR